MLTVLWSEDCGLTASKINSIATDKSWKDTSIHLILNGLLDKGAIEVDGIVRSGRTYSRIFKSSITPDEYSIMQVKQNASCVKDKNSVITNLLVSLIKSDEVNMDSINKIEKLIKDKKEEW